MFSIRIPIKNYTLRKFENKISSKLFHLFIILSFFYLPNLIAQSDDLIFNNLTSEDGLSINTVMCMLQDSRGFIWIGTVYGLNKYDGYKFKVFTPDPNDPFSISNHIITCLAEDGDGNIWVGTSNGLNKYDWKADKFYKYKNDPGDKNSLSNNYILSILKDKSGTIWIGTSDGLNKYSFESNNFTVIKKVSDKIKPGIGCAVTKIIENSNGNLWLGTWNGLTCMQKDGKVLSLLFPNPVIANNVNLRFCYVLYEDQNKNLWIGTNGKGLIKYNQQTGKVVNYLFSADNPNSISNNYVSSILEDRSNNLWIGTSNGLNKFNPSGNNFTRVYHDTHNPYSLVGNTVSSLIQDKDGLIWVSTFRGISRFYQSGNKFNDFNLYDKKSGRQLISDRVTSLYIDKFDNIWDGTKDGLYEIKKNTRQIVRFVNKAGDENSLNNNFVSSVYVDSKGIIWIGTNDNGLNMYNPKTKKFKLFTFDINNKKSISNNGVNSICEDNNGNLWLGTWYGLNYYNRKTGLFTRYTDSTTLKSCWIWDVFKDSKGLIWVATNGGGISKINTRTNNVTIFSTGGSEKNYLSDDVVFTIFESKDGILWFGTINGLNSYNQSTGKTTVYADKDGLPCNVIKSIQEDNKGFLWVGTDKGLSKFDRKSGIFYNYNKKDGLSGLDFVQNISEKSKDGRLFFGLNGLMYFNPDSIKDEYLTAPVVLTDLKIYNKPVEISKNGILTESISTAGKIFIPPGNDVITLEFALMDYFDVKNNTFRYKLDGFDRGWNNIGARNTAIYTNLPPGEYTLFVRATNNSGVKNEKETSLRIIILPFFSQTLWFKLLVVFGLLFCFILIIRMRTNSILKRNKMLESKVTERTLDLDKTIKELNNEIASKDKFFSIIAHDLRSPFTSMLGFSKHLVDEMNDLTKDDLNSIANNILRSAKLTFGLLENLLDWARIKTGRKIFGPEKINLGIVLNGIKELYKWNVTDKGIYLNIKGDIDVTVFADLNMLETIFRNLISNSIKFTQKDGSINISYFDEVNIVKIVVSDTGVGISPERIEKLFQADQNFTTPGTRNEKGSGLGLILCKEFIELNHGTISVNSKVGKGTEFTITLPKFEKQVFNKNI
jgi:ligand-binding sensor domain-containing protein/signal transduction histidine kinase